MTMTDAISDSIDDDNVLIVRVRIDAFMGGLHERLKAIPARLRARELLLLARMAAESGSKPNDASVHLRQASPASTPMDQLAPMKQAALNVEEQPKQGGNFAERFGERFGPGFAGGPP